MKQETFTDIEYSYRKKKTKREEFLKIMIENPWNNGFFIQISFIKYKNWHLYCFGTE